MIDGAAADQDIAGAASFKRYSLARLKRQYTDYCVSKRDELAEQKLSRRYYHAAQWDRQETATLNERGQPIITYNRIGRKIDGVVGLIERLRQDPKAYPRTPKHEQGAELATAVLRYALDINDWKSLSPQTAQDGAIDGIGGIELGIEPGDNGDNDITMERVDPRDFFYDPRSFRPDFSDARYMGLAKWLDMDACIEMFPDMEQEIRDHVGSLSETGGSEDLTDDREIRWTNSQEKRVRLIEHWYKRDGQWIVCYFSGSLEFMCAPSPFKDEKGKSMCRLIMFSNGIDHDGDRYGFVRNLKGPQDEINARRSKGLHLFNSRRIIAERGAVDNVEQARKQAARADGYLEIQPGMRFDFDDVARNADAQGNLAMLTEAKTEMENFGPNPALIGQGGSGVAGSSGRAIALMQQSGIAELGPFILRYRGWKVRVYRAIWNAIQQTWTGERFVRVTDDDDLAQFIQVNGVEMHPMTGQPVLVNALGNLDVDIILDEGPDQVNSMADAFDTLIALSQRGAQVPPDIILELSSLPGSLKKRILQKLEQAQQPNPMAVQAAQVQLAGAAADVDATKAKTAKDQIETAVKAQQARLTAAQTDKTQVETHVAAAPFTGVVPIGPDERAFMGQPPRSPFPMQQGM